MRFLFALSIALVAGAAHAEVRAQVVGFDPPVSEATLGRDQNFYVRIQFDADETVSLWARPYHNGKPVEKGARSNASARHIGSGYALGWFAFVEPAEVDEVRIRAGGGKPYREWELAVQPVKLRWTGQPPSAEIAKAPWVGELQREAEAAWRAERQAEANKPLTVGDAALNVLVIPVMLALVLTALGAPIWALWKWRGGWRAAAMIPVAMMAFVVGRIAVDTSRDPTSHNLWPFEIIIFGAAAVGIILVLAFVRRLTGAAAPSR